MSRRRWRGAPEDLPILFSDHMVVAILEDRKTQTRRISKVQPREPHYLQPMYGKSPDGFAFGTPGLWREVGPDYPDADEDDVHCPYGAPGTRLWVREAWRRYLNVIEYRATTTIDPADHACGCDGNPPQPDCTACLPWRPSIHMPREASRITLEVTKVRAERLQDITEEDARAEGVIVGKPVPSEIVVTDINGVVTRSKGKVVDFTARGAFCHLWDGINGERAPWPTNPWVWVVEFKRVRP